MLIEEVIRYIVGTKTFDSCHRTIPLAELQKMEHNRTLMTDLQSGPKIAKENLGGDRKGTHTYIHTCQLR